GILVNAAVGVRVNRQGAIVAAVAPQQARDDILLALADRFRRRNLRRVGIIANRVWPIGLQGVDTAVTTVEDAQFTAKDAAAVQADDVRFVRSLRRRDVPEENSRPLTRPQRMPDTTVDLVKVRFSAIEAHVQTVVATLFLGRHLW